MRHSQAALAKGVPSIGESTRHAPQCSLGSPKSCPISHKVVGVKFRGYWGSFLLVADLSTRQLSF